jgi:hypothetical protein
MPDSFLQTSYSKGKPMKKEMLGKMKMPAKKKDPMLDLEATLAEIGQEKPDAEMDGMEDMEDSEYSEGPEMEVNIGGEGEGEEEGGQELAMFTDEELQKELDKRLQMSSSKPAKKAPKL